MRSEQYMEAICRSFSDKGILCPRGTLAISKADEPNQFSATLYDRGRTFHLPMIDQAPKRNGHYAVLAKAFVLLAERR